LRKASISARVERSGATSPWAGFAGALGSAIFFANSQCDNAK
jgi:hypothetical protein